MVFTNEHPIFEMPQIQHERSKQKLILGHLAQCAPYP